LQGRAERLRLYYVAMTRAIDRLIVSGAIDLERATDRETPIGWVLTRLEANEIVAAAESEAIELEHGDARFVLRVDRFSGARVPETSAESPSAVQLALFGELPVGAAPLGLPLVPFPPIPTPPAHDVRRLSYSALALFERCPYRYFAERVAGLAPVGSAGSENGEGGLAATEAGDAVHRLLELIPLDDPMPPRRPDLEETVRGWYPTVGNEDLDRIARLVEAYCVSELALRVAALPGAGVERPFAFEHDGVLLHGRLDVLWRDGAQALVVDYKSNALEDADPAAIVEAEYRLQRLVYALACLRDGAEAVEVAYQFLERPDEVVSATFTVADLPALEAELSEAIERIRVGDFRPTPSEFACAGCPALDLVCAGPRLPFAG
jgi:hypothetical protein